MLKPELVRNAEGKISMRVSLGQYECTLPLPEHLATADKARLEEFFRAVVPEMTKNLKRMAAKDRRKNRKRLTK